MISLDEATKDWAVDGIWKIAPSGLAWIAEGARARIGEWARIGEGARIGDKSTDAVDIGWADGYRKCIAQVDGVAYIGAGCRWFTLAEAIAHWSNKPDRELTMCLMQSAIFIAGLRGWKHGDAS